MTALHRPSPLTDEPSVRVCLECGTAWPCLVRMEEIEPPPPLVRRDLESGEVAIVSCVRLGWHVEGIDGMPWHQRMGGTVIAYRDNDDRRLFSILRWFNRQPLTVELAADQVEPASAVPPNKLTLEGHAMRLAGYVGGDHGKPDQKLRWLQWAVICMELAQ